MAEEERINRVKSLSCLMIGPQMADGDAVKHME